MAARPHASAVEMNAAPIVYASYRAPSRRSHVFIHRVKNEGMHEIVLPLKEETVTPLCASHIADGIESPSDLLRHQLIQSDNKYVRWPTWFSANGIALPSSLRGSRFDRS